MSKDILLPKIDLSNSISFMESIAQRHSQREFSDRELSLQELSNLLWVANGVNRANGNRTAPSAMNMQEISVYVFLSTGVYLYEVLSHKLKHITCHDYRFLLNGMQDYADKGALGLLYVGQYSKLLRFGEEKAKELIAIDAGIVSQNVNLYCANANLANVPRISMDTKSLSELLQLPSDYLPILNNIIGYEK